MAAFVRKLFGIGKLPDDLCEEVEAEGLIYLADYVAVTRRVSGAIRGLRSSHSWQLRGVAGVDVATGAGDAVVASEAGRSHGRCALGRGVRRPVTA
jgi:hypothetical protein